jgi:hypothetical protein
MWRRIAWYVGTNISEKPHASIFCVREPLNRKLQKLDCYAAEWGRCGVCICCVVILCNVNLHNVLFTVWTCYNAIHTHFNCDLVGYGSEWFCLWLPPLQNSSFLFRSTLVNDVCRMYVCLYRGIVKISSDYLPVQHSLTDLGDGV